jgi:hypothetical protein
MASTTFAHMKKHRALGALLVLFACESSAPTIRVPVNGAEAGTPDAAVFEGDSGLDAAMMCLVRPAVTVRVCSASTQDYTPRDLASAGTRFPACISDDNTYHSINPDVPSNARIAAVEALFKLLKIEEGAVPSAQDFDDARVLYTQPEGLDSRVQRREDIHYPEVVIAGVAKQCRDLTSAEHAMYPDRCAGPAKVIPLLNDAFQKGSRGESPRVQAARIEAAMVWFLWLSFYKESQGCYGDPGQCDSASSYWGGQQDIAKAPTGYGRIVRGFSEDSYKRGWDAVLAVRCAYDYSQKSTPAPADFAAVKERARDQIDRINNHALALFVRSKLRAVSCEGALESLQILGPVLDVVARKIDAAKADELMAQWKKPSASEIDQVRVESILDALFGCP